MLELDDFKFDDSKEKAALKKMATKNNQS